MSSRYFGDSVFWIEVDKIAPNPFQPRRDFDEARLKDLSDSIRMYGVLQPLVVTRKEFERPDGGLGVEYELIAGERRLRASKLAGITQVPVLIRASDETDMVKLELAIIENLQREDINSVDRARAFERLVKEFKMRHTQVAHKVGKSREYVSNTMRILDLPPEILDAVSAGKLSEGHTRPLLMLTDRPEEQMTLFKEILFKKLTVREAEVQARHIAVERVRKIGLIDPALAELEKRFNESLGTKVSIEKKDKGGKITIEFFSNSDVEALLTRLSENGISSENPAIKKISEATPLDIEGPVDDRAPAEVVAEENNEDLYSIKNFGV